jgi:hypothetical protein
MEMYFLLRGSVRLCRDPTDQDTPAMATGKGDDRKQAGSGCGMGSGGTVEAGDIFGELALFPGV